MKRGEKIMLLFLLFLLSFASLDAQQHVQVIDEIVAQVYHPEGNEIILRSDLLTSIDGQGKTLQEAILERLVVLDAKKFKIQVTEDELDRFLAQLLKQNNWSRSDFIMFLDEQGYSYEEGRELLRQRQMMNQVLDYRVRSDKRMLVNREEAFAIYQKNPSIEEAAFTLSIAYAPFTQHSAQELDKLLAKKKTPQGLAWDEPFTLKMSELAEDRQFIADRKVGEIVLVDKLEDGYELTKLVEKTPAKKIPFDDVYYEIVSKIRQERFMEVLKDYHQELLKKAFENKQLKIYRKDLEFPI
jgi:parvulin-like peptidyl-prolyl isomerase